MKRSSRGKITVEYDGNNWIVSRKVSENVTSYSSVSDKDMTDIVICVLEIQEKGEEE